MTLEYADPEDDYVCKKCGGKVIRANTEGPPHWRCTQGHGKISWNNIIDQRDRKPGADNK